MPTPFVVAQNWGSLADFNRAARLDAGAHTSMPVEVVEGDSAPSVAGESYYHTTPSGELCEYPSAYRKAFGRPVYHPSTRRVEVGADWRPASW